MRYLFGEQTGDQLADEILRALRGAADAGLNRTEINKGLDGHRRREEIDRALRVLAESGLAVSRSEQTTGRPAERWFAVSYPAEKAEKAEKGCLAAAAGGAYSAYSAFSAPSENGDSYGSGRG